MDKQTQKRYSLLTGLVAGACTDGYLRAVSGDEGNLLVHSVVFLVAAAVVYAIASLIIRTHNKIN
ncbi:MAG: hypothetical protein PUC87_02235 [Galactobacillus timonensis]|nr:hypothetical protein [Galactobacillus timonensis]